MTICQNRMFRECLAGMPYLRATRLPASYSRNTSVSILSWLFTFQTWVFKLSLLHTTLTIKSHIKYRVQKIEQNYNQIWHKIKANKTHSCKLQLYNLFAWAKLPQPIPTFTLGFLIWILFLLGLAAINAIRNCLQILAENFDGCSY